MQGVLYCTGANTLFLYCVKREVIATSLSLRDRPTTYDGIWGWGRANVVEGGSGPPCVAIILSSLGNRTVAGSYRYDNWQLQFWDTFLFFERIDIPIPTF